MKCQHYLTPPSCDFPFVGRIDTYSDDVTARPVFRPTYPGAVSYRDGFIPDEVQPDNLGLGLVTKVAKDGIFHHCLKVGPVFPLREDAVTQGASVETAFDGFSHLEYDLCWCPPYPLQRSRALVLHVHRRMDFVIHSVRVRRTMRNVTLCESSTTIYDWASNHRIHPSRPSRSSRSTTSATPLSANGGATSSAAAMAVVASVTHCDTESGPRDHQRRPHRRCRTRQCLPVGRRASCIAAEGPCPCRYRDAAPRKSMGVIW